MRPMDFETGKGSQDWALILQPETSLEGSLLEEPLFTAGLGWGFPRYGHPEGAVYKHILEVLDNINRFVQDAAQRELLRVVAFAHDTFKYMEAKGKERDWAAHHGVLARRFMERYPLPEHWLDIIEWHDEAYYIWRLEHLYKRPDEAQQRLDRFMGRMKGDVLQLYYLFFVCDTLTGDKTRAPLHWFEERLQPMEQVVLLQAEVFIRQP
jgi:hypothetical protein